MSKVSSLVRKIGKSLGEYFLGIETYKFYSRQKNILEQINNNTEIYSIRKDIDYQNFEAIFSGKIVPTSLSLLGSLTIFSNSYLASEPLTSPESIKSTIVGLATIVLSEATRFYFNNLIEKDKEKIEIRIKSYIENKKP